MWNEGWEERNGLDMRVRWKMEGGKLDLEIYGSS